jgi:hypothetical protein
LTLTAAIYPFTLSLGSRSILTFVLSLAAGFFYSFAYASVISASPGASAQPEGLFGPLATVAILVFFLVHVGERYNRHISERIVFLDLTLHP